MADSENDSINIPMGLIKSIIYNGEDSPHESSLMGDDKYRGLLREICNKQDELFPKITKEIRMEIEDIDELKMMLNSMHTEYKFEIGFKLGVNLILEIISKEKTNFGEERSALEKLYYGLTENESGFYSDDLETLKEEKKTEEQRAKLYELLDDEQKKLLNKYDDQVNYEKIASMSYEYEKGFSSGAKIIIEALRDLKIYS